MGVFSENAIIGAAYAAAAGGAGYSIDNSCRFDRGSSSSLLSSAYLISEANTVSFWFKRTKTGVNHYLFQGNDMYCVIGTNDLMEVGRSGCYGTTARVFRDTSAWYHVHLEATSSNTKLYINGELDQTITCVNSYGSGAMRIGGTIGGANYFDGYFAEFHVVDGITLTPDSFGEKGDYGEWKAKAYSGSHGTNGYYMDFSSESNPTALTKQGGAEHSNAQYVAGLGGTSIYFDGGGDYITSPSDAKWNFGTGPFTVEFWIYSAASSGTNTIIIGNSSTGSALDTHWRIWRGLGNTNQLIFGTGATWQYDGTTTYPANDWTHVAYTRDSSGDGRLFYDGVLDATGVVANTKDYSGTNELWLGKAYDGAEFNGYLHEVRVSNVCRYDANFTAFGQGGGTISSPTRFTTDANTLLLIHSNESNGSTIFTDTSSTGLGTDAAGSNHFTVAGIAAHDQVPDSPTNNWCIFNFNDQQVRSANFYEGGLRREGVSAFNGGGTGSLFTRNKIYYEVYIHSRTNNYMSMGFAPDNWHSSEFWSVGGPSLPGKSGYHGVSFSPDYGGVIYDGVTSNAASHTFVIGDVIMLALDPASGKFWHGINGTWKDGSGGNTGNPSTGANPVATLVQSLVPDYSWTGNAAAYSTSNSVIANFGQDHTFAGNKGGGVGAPDSEDYGSFYYTPPTGFLSLCSKNQPDCAVIPSEHFGIMLTTHAAGARTFASHGVPAGAAFAPEMVWMKTRSTGHNHRMCDVIMGPQVALTPSTTAAADTSETTGLLSFDSDGFTLGNSGDYAQTSGSGMVYWNWKLGGTPTANNVAGAGNVPTAGSVKIDGVNKSDALAGTIAATKLTANAKAGMSLIWFTGNGVQGATVAHGLTRAPELVVSKCYTGDQWVVGAISDMPGVDCNFTDFGVRDGTNAWLDHNLFWNDQDPTATVIRMHSQGGINGSGLQMRHEAYHSVEGYSKVGCYRGNSQDDGTFCYTGFRPRLIIAKVINTTDGWQMMDTARDPYNVANKRLEANVATAEATASWTNVDFLSNGFKTRGTDTVWNANYNYLYIAFAEIPFKNTNAR